MSKEIKFKKIPLKLLIETLIHIQNSGADYVDIVGVQGDNQDVVTLSVEEEYMASPDTELPDDVKLINDKKLSDEDIDDLMQ